PSIEQLIAERYGIKPHCVYRRGSDEANNYLGNISQSVIEREIKKGTIPMPFPLTEHGRAQAWYGWQFVEMIKKREEAARKRLELLRDPNRPRRKGGRPRKARP